MFFSNQPNKRYFEFLSLVLAHKKAHEFKVGKIEWPLTYLAQKWVDPNRSPLFSIGLKFTEAACRP